MNLVWHIVRKDFRRLWVPLVLWTVLLVAKGEVGVRALTGGATGADRLFYFQLSENTLLALDLIVNALLVAALVHEDALVGTRVFWATRPIGGGRLLAAKFLGAALMFGALPLLVAVRWWVACGYGAAELARAALALVEMQAWKVCGALVLAALTKNMNQFLAWALGLIVAMIAWGVMLALMVEGTQAEITRGVSETRDVGFVTLALVGGAAVIALQFFARQRERAVLVAGVTAGLIAVVSAGTWDCSRLWARAPRTPALASGITITVENVKLGTDSAMDYVLRGLPENLGVSATADHTWRWPNGDSAAARSAIAGAWWPGAAEWRTLGLTNETTGVSARTYVASGVEGAEKWDRVALKAEFFLWSEKKERLSTEPASYTGELHAVLSRPKLEFELPLRDGEWRGAQGFGVRIKHVAWSEGEWRVTVMESRPAWTSYRNQRPSLGHLVDEATEPTAGFALVNRARGEAVKLWPGRFPVVKFLVGTQELAWIAMQCRVPRDEAVDQPDAPPHWLEGATLAVVRYHEEARFDREVKVERFGATPEGAAAKGGISP